MRHNYVGDIGDFYKYALLRHLTGQTSDANPPYKLGVVWYLYPDDCKTTDGLHTDYLTPSKESKFRPLDASAYDCLADIISRYKNGEERRIQQIREYGMFNGVAFYEEPLTFMSLRSGAPQAIATRKKHRSSWLHKALQTTNGCALIFVDPDNGLPVKSMPSHRNKGAKYCFYEELSAFWQRGQSLVIYQHRNMHETTENQIANRKKELSRHFGDAAFIECVYFPAYSGRIFFIVGNQEMGSVLERRRKSFIAKWNGHVR